jgi:hypothetical protein
MMLMGFVEISSLMFHFCICSLFTRPIYLFLESPVVTKDKSSRDAVFNLIGVLVQKYNHSIGLFFCLIWLQNFVRCGSIYLSHANSFSLFLSLSLSFSLIYLCVRRYDDVKPMRNLAVMTLYEASSLIFVPLNFLT